MRVPGRNQVAATVVEGDVGTSESESVVQAPVVEHAERGRIDEESGGPRRKSGLSGIIETKRNGERDVPVASTTEQGR